MALILSFHLTSVPRIKPRSPGFHSKPLYQCTETFLWPPNPFQGHTCPHSCMENLQLKPTSLYNLLISAQGFWFCWCCFVLIAHGLLKDIYPSYRVATERITSQPGYKGKPTKQTQMYLCFRVQIAAAPIQIQERPVFFFWQSTVFTPPPPVGLVTCIARLSI